MIQLTLTLKMTTAQVVETSVTVNNNSPIQDYVHPDDQTQPTFKNRTVGLSQSNARKYNRQYKLVNQRKVPVTKFVAPEKVSLADGGSSANALGFLLSMVSFTFGCQRNFSQLIICKLDSIPSYYRFSLSNRVSLTCFHRCATSKQTAVMAPMSVNVPSRVVRLTVGTSVTGMSLIPHGKSVPCRIHG